MGTWSKVVLSGSTAGEGIPVTGLTPSTGTVIHTPASGNGLDEVVVYAYASASTAKQISIAIGPTTSPLSRFTHNIQQATAPPGLELIIPGLVLSATTAVVRAYATAVGEITVFGWANRNAT